MSLDRLKKSLSESLHELQTRGALKGRENVVTGIQPPQKGNGPRYFLAGYGEREFLRMNSNSYLGLSLHPAVIKAEEMAVRSFGTGPGAVRFISGTCEHHVQLEKSLAKFHGRKAGMIFSAAYAAVLGVLPQLISDDTIVLSDALNHNCIINAIRLARPAQKLAYKHLDMNDLEDKLKGCLGQARRILVVTDGIFSMRGDFVPLDKLSALCRQYDAKFAEGVISIVDDSHGVGAFGQSGKGVEEYTKSRADILVSTLGKALGVNGGYVVADTTVIDYLRETAPFYIYSNPITAAEAAAAKQALELLDSSDGLKLLDGLRQLTRRFETGLLELDCEIIAGEHPIVPLIARVSGETQALVRYLFEHGVLATGLSYPVVPRGEEEVRFQISASHTEKDIDYVLAKLAEFTRSSSFS